MDSAEQEHHHYWPGEKTIPLTPQARRLGFAFEVYATHSVWGECITWTKGRNTNPDKRIFELLESCYEGLTKSMSTEAGDGVYFEFKHWFWDRARPKAKKQTKAKYGARLLLDPETEEPWLLIFCIDRDGKEVLKRGEPKEDRTDDSESGSKGTDLPGDSPGLDLGD